MTRTVRGLVRQVEAARRLGINRATIHHHIATGALRVRAVAGVRFITAASLAKLEAARRQGGRRG